MQDTERLKRANPYASDEGHNLEQLDGPSTRTRLLLISKTGRGEKRSAAFQPRLESGQRLKPYRPEANNLVPSCKVGPERVVDTVGIRVYHAICIMKHVMTSKSRYTKALSLFVSWQSGSCSWNRSMSIATNCCSLDLS